MDPHEVLGVSPDATEAETRAAYRRLVRRHHPDHHVGEPAGVRAAEAARMAEVTGAWALLNDPVALARHQARTTRVGRAPGAPRTDRAPTRDPSGQSETRPGRPDGFDYRRAARAEFDDSVTGHWGRTPPPVRRPTPSSGPRDASRPRRARTGGRRWPTALGWMVAIALVVGMWLVASDSGQTVWAILRGIVDTREATTMGAAPGADPDPGFRTVRLGDTLDVRAPVSSSALHAVGDSIDVVEGDGAMLRRPLDDADTDA